MLFLKIILWIVAVVLILSFPLSAFAGNMMATPRGGGFISLILSVIGIVLVVLLVTGRIG